MIALIAGIIGATLWRNARERSATVPTGSGMPPA